MSRKKKTGQSAPPLPEGEFYSPYDVERDNPLWWVKCLDCFRFLSTDTAVKRHLDTGCVVKDYKTGMVIDATHRPIQ